MEQQALFNIDVIYEQNEYVRTSKNGHEKVVKYTNSEDPSDFKFEAHFTVNKKVQIGPNQFQDHPMPASFFFGEDVDTIQKAFEGFKEGAIEYLQLLEEQIKEAQQPSKKIIMANEQDADLAGKVIDAANRFKKD